MKKEYLNIYNNLIKLTRNKLLFEKLQKNDSFSERLVVFLLHFAFFLKIYKSNQSKDELQDIYDFVFRQIELSIREIGYGDTSINKQMKNYINLFYSIIGQIDKWEKLDSEKKTAIFLEFLNVGPEKHFFVEYFEKYRLFLLNNTLKNFSKDVLKFNF